MKGFTRFCLILAGALGVIGLAGIGIGMALGARPAQFLDLAPVSYTHLEYAD